MPQMARKKGRGVWGPQKKTFLKITDQQTPNEELLPTTTVMGKMRACGDAGCKCDQK